MSCEITWVRSLVFSNYFLNCFMIVLILRSFFDKLEIYGMRLVMRLMVG